MACIELHDTVQNSGTVNYAENYKLLQITTESLSVGWWHIFQKDTSPGVNEGLVAYSNLQVNKQTFRLIEGQQFSVERCPRTLLAQQLPQSIQIM